MLDLEKISKNSLIRIGMPRGVVVGFVTSPLNYGGSATYADASAQLASAVGGLAGDVAKRYSGGTKVLDDIKAIGASVKNLAEVITQGLNRTGAMASPVRATPIWTTYKGWQSSTGFGFDLELTFLAFQEGMDVKKPVRELTRCTYPVMQGTSMAAVFAPNKYTINADQCVSVRVGRYFYVPRILLIKSSNFSFSKECMPDGNPLYATGKVSFECYRELSDEDVDSFLIDPLSAGESTDLSQKETEYFKNPTPLVGGS